MTEDREAFWDAAVMLACEHRYYDLPADELAKAGEVALLLYAAILAPLDPTTRKNQLRAMLARFGAELAG